MGNLENAGEIYIKANSAKFERTKAKLGKFEKIEIKRENLAEKLG